MGSILEPALRACFDELTVGGGDLGCQIAVDADVVVLAISSNEQCVNSSRMAKEWLAAREHPEQVATLLNINSVQASVREALGHALEGQELKSSVVIISLHHMHPPAGFQDLFGKNWVLTGIDVLGGGEMMGALKEEARALVARMVEEFPKKYGGNPDARPNLLDLSERSMEVEQGEEVLTLNGSQIHDWIAAVYQATFHMLKLVPGIQATEEYRKNFSTVVASDDLSRSIVEENPFARTLNEKILTQIGEDRSFANVVATLKKLITEEGRKFASIPGAEAVMTANVKKLVETSL